MAIGEILLYMKKKSISVQAEQNNMLDAQYLNNYVYVREIPP
jgi:hypothetical protein